MSESEGEMDGPQNQVILPQHIPGRGNIKSAQSAIRLTEIGPRMMLQLVKIEEGVCAGEVLYHEFVTKTEEELKNLKEFREKKRKLKEERKREQAENVQRKAEEKEHLKAKAVAGQKKDETDDDEEEVVPADDEMDDADYYRQEVGEEPDPELFLSRHGGKRKSFGGGKSRDYPARKRTKFDKFKGGNASDKGSFKTDRKEFKKGGRDFKGKDKDFKKGREFSGKDKKFGKKRDFNKVPMSKGRKGHSKVGDMKNRGKSGRGRR